MAIYKDDNNYKVIKLDSDNQPQDYDLPFDNNIATEQEMQDYILNMTPANITASGSSLIIEFEPFPKKYVNYMRQRQYNGYRTQIFWQLVRYVGRAVYRKTNVFSSSGVYTQWRVDETSDLYHWTFPTRRILTATGAPAEGSMRPYYFTLTPKEATSGRIIWSDGYSIIDRFENRPFGEANNVFPKKIAIIIGMATHGMLGNGPWIYKKSNDFKYNDNGPIIPSDLEIAISEANITMTKENDDYFISFSNINTTLITYAEENKTNNNYAIFLQTFNYFGGQTHGTNRDKQSGTGVEKKIKSPSKNQLQRKNLSASDLQNGVYLSELTQLGKTKWLRAKYKHEPETFHNISVALVLANPGMNDGFHTYKESNKINLIE